jgi:hypothetical protein
VYGCRAYVTFHKEKIPKSKKLDPRAWVGYLVGYTASNIWKIWNPLKGTITEERDVTFDEDRVFDPYQPFHADAIRISDLPTPPIEINELPNIDDLPSLVGGADEELDEVVEARGVNEDGSELNEILNMESGKAAAETPERQLLTPESMPIQNDYLVNSIEQDIDATPRPAQANTQYGIPGGWIDSPQRDTTSIRLDLQTPRSPTRIADSPEPETPVRLTDTLPESPLRLDQDSGEDDVYSPSRQLMEEVQRMSIDPDFPDDDVEEIPRRPKYSVSADFLRRISLKENEHVGPVSTPDLQPKNGWMACKDIIQYSARSLPEWNEALFHYQMNRRNGFIKMKYLLLLRAGRQCRSIRLKNSFRQPQS